MKLTSILSIVLTLQVSAATIPSKTIAFSKKNVVLKKWIIERKTISFIPKAEMAKKRTNLAVVKKLVKGRVTNENGEPIPGANIYVKGTTVATQTGFDGDFSIEVPDNATKLVISFIGMQEQEVSIGKTPLIIVLKEEGQKLDNVVVVGYGTQRKQDVTGSVSSISKKDFKDQPIARIDQAIQGRASGVQVTNSDNSPGGNVQIRIRGGNSVFGSNDPLIVIDGFIGGELGSLNPNDIESINILKDASATAIYGSRGANGVVLVTTKKGKGKAKIEYSTFLTSQSVLRKVDVLSASEYALAANDYLKSTGLPAAFTASQIQGFEKSGGTDWQDEIFRNAIIKNHNLSISGAGENMSYYVSSNFFDQDGIIENTNLKRFTLRSNLRGDISEKLSFGLNTNFSREKSNITDVGFLAETTPTTAALQWSPTLPVRRADGTFTQAIDLPGQTKSPNPYATATEPTRQKVNDSYNLNAYLDYELLKVLTFRTNVGGLFVRFNSSQYFPRTTFQGSPSGFASIANNSQTRLLNTNTLTYKKEIGKHSITLTGIAEFQKDSFNSSMQSAAGFITDANLFNNFEIANIQLPSKSAKVERKINSYAARGVYSFNDKYILSGSYRIDGSSVLANGNKYQGFSSLAGSWIVSNEEFLAKKEIISNLKLRAGWGTSGSQAVPPNSSVAILGGGIGYPFDGNNIVVGLTPNQIGNPNLTWEKTAQTNFGIDLGLLNNKINFSVDLYNKLTSGLLIENQLPIFSSFAPVLSNQGEIGNKGIDLSLSTNIIDSEKFSWSSGVTFSKNTNEILSLGKAEGDIVVLGGGDISGGGSNFYQLKVGNAIGDMYGYVYDGVWKSSEATKAAAFGSAVGGRKYKDINNDGVLNTADISKIGKALPDFAWGWNNTFEYKSISLNLFFQGSQGNDIFNLVRVRSDQSNSDGFGAGGRIRDRFVAGINENTNVAALGVAGQSLNQSSEYIENGSYVRLKNITLAYSLPKTVLQQLNLSNFRMYISGQNLLTIDKYSGYDPEVSTAVSIGASDNNSLSQNTNLGIDGGAYPSSKNFTLGIDVAF